MAKKIKCGKCGGTGRLNAFLHIQGGKCFPCKGKGYWTISDKAWKAKQAKKAEQAKQRVIDDEKAVKREIADLELIKSSKLLGPETLASCAAHPMFASQTAQHLRKIKAGKFTRKSHPWIFDSLAK